MKRARSITRVFTATDIKNIITCTGSYDTKKGSYISSADHIAYEQRNWCSSDSAKNIDFTASKFWVTTDDETAPVGFDTVVDAVEYC